MRYNFMLLFLVVHVHCGVHIHVMLTRLANGYSNFDLDLLKLTDRLSHLSHDERLVNSQRVMSSSASLLNLPIEVSFTHLSNPKTFLTTPTSSYTQYTSSPQVNTFHTSANTSSTSSTKLQPITAQATSCNDSSTKMKPDPRRSGTLA